MARKVEDRTPLPSGAAPVPPGPNLANAPSLSRLRHLVPYAVGLSVITITVIAIVLQRERGDDVPGSLRRLWDQGAWTIPLALGLHLTVQFVWSIRLRLLSAGLGHPMPWREVQPIVTAGLFAAAVTPGRVGGEPLRIGLFMRRGLSATEASRLVLADRASDIAFFLTAGLASTLALPYVFGPESGHIQLLGFLGMTGLSLVTAFVVLVLMRPTVPARALSRLARLWDRLRRRDGPDRTAMLEAYFQGIPAGLRELERREGARLWLAFGLTVLLWSLEFTILWVLLKGFGFEAMYAKVWVAGVLVVLVASVPAMPGGTGLAELAALALLTPLAPGMDAAFLVVWRGLTYYVDLILGGAVAAWIMGRPMHDAAAGPRQAA